MHFRKWGAVYIFALLFVGSWIGQAVAMMDEIQSEGWKVFWSATLENWQSEWLQLIFQAVFLLGAKHLVFKVDAEDLERIELKLDALLKGSKEERERALKMDEEGSMPKGRRDRRKKK